MADPIKIGSRVDIIGKNLKGTVAYIGTTMFAAGKWIGVVLDVPKGKNDGSVQGKRYFTCGENYGVFVRQQHIKALSEAEPKPASSKLKPPSERVKPRSKSPTLKTEPVDEPVPISQPEPSTPAVVDAGEGGDVKLSIKKELQSSLANQSSLVGAGISMAEVESLRAQVRDWKDKFETIRLKRQADREKLKDVEKSKLQVQQLLEYKSRMSEQNQELLKQVRDAKKEAKEAIESKERYMEEMSDAHESIEMATLDKEMAEEKVETLQLEVDTLKEKVEELQTDLEIIKAEVETTGDDGSPSNYQLKQMEEQNSRLKEALVRMRDLSSAEKIEHQNLEKQMEKRNKELEEFRKKNESLLAELEKAESMIDELKEQVDVAMVAEEMVEELTDKNLKLEEKVVDYEEQIQDLETMNEMNEELHENARENEMELREEVDLARSQMRNAERKVEAANEAMSDYQETILKFRALVQELQETNEELRQKKSEGSMIEPEPRPQIDYQMKIIETKTAARAVDLELRKIDAQQAKDHVRYLSMFVPPTFSTHGGDGECVEVLLLAQRLHKKADLISRHVSDKFDVSSISDAREEMIGVRGEQLTFATNLICDMTEMQALMEGYESTLNRCSVDLFQKIGTLYSEMAPHERIFDYLVDQLRRDSLDETTLVVNLTKAIEFFGHLYGVHIAKEPFVDCWKLLDNHIKQSFALLQSIQVNSLRLKCFLGTGNDLSDMFLLLKDLRTLSSDIIQFCKKLRRRMPKESEGSQQEGKRTLKFPKDVTERVQACGETLCNIHKILLEMTRNCTSQMTSDNTIITPKEMQDIFNQSCQKYYSVSGNGHDNIRRAAGDVMTSMNLLVTSLQEGEFDAKEEVKPVSPPIARRAQLIKSEVSDCEGLASKLNDKDVLVQELRKSLKLKVAEISEIKVKIGMLERKLEKSGKVEQEQLNRVQNENDNLKEELKKKEREYDETLDALQRDIDTLEYEKSELKQRLTAQSKRSIAADVKSGASASPKSSIASIIAGAALSQGDQPGTQVVIKDSPLLVEQIRSLQIALENKSFENYRLQGKSLCDRLRALKPIELPRKIPNGEQKTELIRVRMNLEKLKSNIISMACLKVVDIRRSENGDKKVGSRSPEQQFFREQVKLKIAKELLTDLQIRAQKLTSTYKYRV